MNSGIRYADLWALLRRLGYDCTRRTDGNRHRVCEHTSAGSLLTLADHPAERTVHPETLHGVRLELANFGLLSPDQFDRWAGRRTRANATGASEGNGARETSKPREGLPDGSPRP
jgi:hypothetical protein